MRCEHSAPVKSAEFRSISLSIQQPGEYQQNEKPNPKLHRHGLFRELVAADRALIMVRINFNCTTGTLFLLHFKNLNNLLILKQNSKFFVGIVNF